MALVVRPGNARRRLDFAADRRHRVGVLSPLSPLPATEPSRDCPRCPRLVAFRQALRVEHPGWWNAPVPVWGDPEAWLAVVGLAPGKHGANRTGRPFTGDFAGELLFETLLAHGLATGSYRADPADDLRLTGAVIVNSVRCLPPENKPTPEEIRTCRPFLEAPLAALSQVRVVVALGKIAHDAAVRAFGGKLSAMPFGHAAEHRLADGRVLIDSYHCSRYNQNTGKLTAPMFHAVFDRACAIGNPHAGNGAMLHMRKDQG
jgi:uracil-DNA glycosylase